MFTKRPVRASLFMGVLWGGIHAAFSLLWGAYSFPGWESRAWSALPGWLTIISIHGFRAGVLAGFLFALLLHRLESSRTAATLSNARVAMWGALASVPAYFVAEGALPLLLRRDAPLHVLIEPVPYFTTVGLLAALVTMAVARRGSAGDGGPSLQRAPAMRRLKSGTWWQRLWPARFKAHADPRYAVPSAA